MDLALDTVRTTGRAARPLEVEVIRELNPADLALLEVERGTKPQSIQKLRDSHHAIAKALAGGMSNAEAALATGYTPSRISILRSDPAFQELMAHYAGLSEDAFIDVQARLALLNMDMVEELRDRLHEEPEKFDNGTLLDGIKALSDRTGLGPSSKQTTVNVNVDLAGRVARGRERVMKLVNGAGTGLLSSAPAASDRGEGEAADSEPSPNPSVGQAK